MPGEFKRAATSAGSAVGSSAVLDGCSLVSPVGASSCLAWTASVPASPSGAAVAFSGSWPSWAAVPSGRWALRPARQLRLPRRHGGCPVGLHPRPLPFGLQCLHLCLPPSGGRPAQHSFRSARGRSGGPPQSGAPKPNVKSQVYGAPALFKSGPTSPDTQDRTWSWAGATPKYYLCLCTRTRIYMDIYMFTNMHSQARRPLLMAGLA